MNKKYTAGFFVPIFIFFCVLQALLLGAHAQEADNGYRLRTVVIDAGHGGKDPGSVGKKTTEKAVVLAIALKLGKYIEENMDGVKVVYTRTTDTFVELYKRAQIANDSKADLFISIHANGLDNPQVSGTETLVLGSIRTGENFEVAKKENSVILLEEDYSTRYAGFDPNIPESYLMFSLMQERYLGRSIDFAALVQEQFRERAQRKDRSVKQQSLLVLAQTAMPGVLIETGFVTNPEEEKYLMSETGQDYLASAIFRAFRDYKEIVESRRSFTAMHSEQGQGKPDTVKEDHTVNETPQVKPPVQASPAPALSKVEFKVQIAASSRKIGTQAREFKGLPEVCEYQVGNLYKYAVGKSPTFQEIIPFSKQIKEKFPDAFVIAVKDNKIIPLDQALKETATN